MRIWDIDPGYLNRQSLLGEHLELHGIASIIINNKKGYSHHPETLRWNQYGWALRRRHQQLAAEMALRGYHDKSPLDLNSNAEQWPELFIDLPYAQFRILHDKYEHKEAGRIALPRSAQELWRHHKYSVLARNAETYKQIGRQVSVMKSGDDYSTLASQFTAILRTSPSEGGMRNALQHMWGYVSKFDATSKGEFEQWSLKELLAEIQQRVRSSQEPYLGSSTALAELMVWV